MARKISHDSRGATLTHAPSLKQIETIQLCHWFDRDSHLASASGIEAVSIEFHLHHWSHEIDPRHVTLRNKFKRRCEWIVRTALEHEGRRVCRHHQSRQNSL